MSAIEFKVTVLADGATESRNIPVSADHVFHAIGDFGGGTLSLEASPDGGDNWFTVDEIKSPARVIRHISAGELIRFNMAGSTSPSVVCGVVL